MKYKVGIVSEIKRKKQMEETQQMLRKKYDLPEKVVVVEKSNIAKFTINTFATVIRTTATICILTLAAIGLLALTYPGTRAELLNVMAEMYNQMKGMI